MLSGNVTIKLINFMEDGFIGSIIGFVVGFVVAWSFTTISLVSDIDEIKKEAFDRGYMEKQINSEDEVIYIWKKQ